MSIAKMIKIIFNVKLNIKYLSLIIITLIIMSIAH